MNLNYKLWIFWVNIHLIKLIQLRNINYFPKYVALKLLTPNLYSIFKIIKHERLPWIEAENKYEMKIFIGISIRIFILNLLDEMFQLLPNKDRLSITIHIWFDTENFTNGSKRIHLLKTEEIDLFQTLKLLLDKINLIDEIYNILYIHTVKIKIIYGRKTNNTKN